jgi:ribosome-associated heat shock protein Hsp15
MRLDKFLWYVRYYKTRSVATNACKKGKVKVNEQIAKPGKNVYVMDEISLRKDQINYQFTINEIPKNRLGAKLVDIYRTDTTPKDAFKAKELLKFSKDYYRKKGTGRPTKKDRRDIDDFNIDPEEN